MANRDLAHGFKAFGKACPLERFSKDADNATPAYPGDLLQFEADGNINPAVVGNTELIGVGASFLTGSAAGNVMIYDDPDQKFTGQDDGAGTPAQALLGLNFDHIATDGSLTTLLSAHEIDGDSHTTATAGLRVLDFVLRADNTVADNAEWVFRINEHNLAKTTGV